MLCEQIKHLGPIAIVWLRYDEQHPCVKEVSKAVAQVQSEGYSETGQRLLPTSYRPISLRRYTYKLLERMILNRLNLITEHTIIKEQTGFRAGKSSTSQLLNVTPYIEDGYEKSLTTGTVVVDLSAAYDTVNHIVLLTKLYGMATTSRQERRNQTEDPRHSL